MTQTQVQIITEAIERFAPLTDELCEALDALQREVAHRDCSFQATHFDLIAA